jgi:FKBP-type peptidyl-prolyl cis-trans isomerase SlyD
MRITDNTVVTIRYIMSTTKGEILENIMEAAPITYVHGAGSILPALEAGLKGLEAGEKKSILLTPENGFPGLNDDFCLDVIVDDVRMATEEDRAPKSPDNTFEEGCGDGCCC